VRAGRRKAEIWREGPILEGETPGRHDKSRKGSVRKFRNGSEEGPVARLLPLVVWKNLACIYPTARLDRRGVVEVVQGHAVDDLHDRARFVVWAGMGGLHFGVDFWGGLWEIYFRVSRVSVGTCPAERARGADHPQGPYSGSLARSLL